MSSKWSFSQLKDEYSKMGIDYNEVFQKIKILCVKTLMAVEPGIATLNSTALRTAKHKG